MLAQFGRHVSQAAVAREQGTGPAGTNWADDTGYPVPDELNANQGKNNYAPVALPAVPAPTRVREFEADLVADLNHQGGVPLAGNAYEVAGGPHLAGNPVNQTILHGFDIRGYQDFGAVTDYEDLGPAAPVVSVPVADACGDLLELLGGMHGRVLDRRTGQGRDQPVAAVLALGSRSVMLISDAPGANAVHPPLPLHVISPAALTWPGCPPRT